MTNKPTEYRFEEWIEKSLNGHGYTSRLYQEYDRELCLIKEELLAFIRITQKEEYDKLHDQFDTATDVHICKTVDKSIAQRGIIETLRKGISTRGCSFDLLYFEPKSGLNPEHHELYKHNRFSLVRQLHYSRQNENSIDMALVLNGIPIITMELKNQLSGQNFRHSENQYRNDRDHKEPLLSFKRCLAHFCVDNDQVSMTTRLRGQNTRFLPYNKGISNRLAENDYRTEYLWNEVLIPSSLLDIIENFVVVSEETKKEWNDKAGKVVEEKESVLVFPRYHQLDVIRKLRASIRQEGVGNKYLIQHTTGSGKSYSIGWLSHMLTSLYRGLDETKRMFDTIIVVTDRRILDKQLQHTLKQLEQTKGVVCPVDTDSKQLLDYLEKGKDIIVTTIQKFPHISAKVSELKGQTFGIVIDEVHSSQTGETAKHLKKSLSITHAEDEDEDTFDYEEMIRQEIEARGKQEHISFFGFTGTPKNKTLELFGRKGEDGKFRAFHYYTMMQSIAEGFTLDVLQHYTTYSRYFKIHQQEEEDKAVPKSKVLRAIVNHVDSHPEVIHQKVGIILQHFREVTSKKVKGRAKGMVVVRSRKHCVLFFQEMKKQMKEMNLPYSCLVAFSGTVKHDGTEHTENTLNKDNGLKSSDIASGLKEPGYRILIVSNKFQTGFDEPLLHSMFIDKKLSDVQCVQTLSRLNRVTSGKTDTFVLDFVNDTEDIVEAFKPFYTTTILSGETDPDKLYSLMYEIEAFNLYTKEHVERFCREFYRNTDTDEKLHPIIDEVVDNWKRIEEDEKKDEYKSLLQSFCRMYSFVSQIIDFVEVEWEKHYVFYRYLNKKLPKGKSERIDVADLVDLDSLRIQMISESQLHLAEEVGVLEPRFGYGAGIMSPDELVSLAEIIEQINNAYGINLTEEDRVDLEHVNQRIQKHQELATVMQADNTEEAQKDFFNRVLRDIIADYYGDRLDFYKKVIDPRVLPVLQESMYRGYKINPSSSISQ